MSDVEITVTQLLRDEGTILVFEGVDENGAEVTFAAEHRPGWDIVAAIDRDEDPVAVVPDYFILTREATSV